MDSTLITTQVTVSALISWGLEKLKNSPKFTLLTQQSSDKVKTLASAIAAAAAAAGIHFQFDHTAGALLITGLTTVSVMHFVGEWLRNIVFQELIYKAAIKAK